MAGQGNGYDDALAHAAGELMRKFVHTLFRGGDTNALQELDGCVPGFPGVHSPVEHQGFPNLPADAVYGIERRHWFLENDADMAAADAVHVRLFCLNQVAALEQNLPVQNFPHGLGQQPDNGHGRNAFAAA